jgi:hypothetical protein
MLCIVNKVIQAKAGIQALLPGFIEQLQPHDRIANQPVTTPHNLPCSYIRGRCKKSFASIFGTKAKS